LYAAAGVRAMFTFWSALTCQRFGSVATVATLLRS